MAVLAGTEPEHRPAIGVERRTTLAAVIVLGLLNAADVVLTRFALGHGAVEANPLSRALLSGGRVELFKVGALGLLWIRAVRRRPTLAFALACWAAAGAYAMVVLSNVFVVWSLH